jgi:hypothetical protein
MSDSILLNVTGLLPSLVPFTRVCAWYFPQCVADEFNAIAALERLHKLLLQIAKVTVG